MPLPSPNLDDRRFQELVDEAKLRVQQHCPDWTDHNVSDPGVTLIECFAFMVDQLIFRLNQVPARHYVKFLDLLGVRLRPPTDAETHVTFWLSAPQPDVVSVTEGIEVSTSRTETDDPVVFSVVEDLAIVPCKLARAGCSLKPGQILDYTRELAGGNGFAFFNRRPTVGDKLLIGLSEAVPRCAVLLRFDCRVEGVGVDPTNPPLVWEAWTDDGWKPCEVDRDGTGGFNRPGDVVLHVPGGHIASVKNGERAGWLQCRLVEADEGQPTYSDSPTIQRLEAATIGGTTKVAHAAVVRDEVLGLSEGVPGQRFQLRQHPVVPSGRPVVVEVAGGGGWDEWSRVDNFGESGPHERNFTFDPVAGEIVFGPAVRAADGSLTQHGAVPAKGAPVRVPYYRTGGGRHGNVARGALNVLKSSIPYVTSVENRRPASGGVDAEDIEAAKVRGPIILRTRNRAVTVEDYEELAHDAAPEAARVRAVPAGVDGTASGAVRVLVVPAVQGSAMRFEDLVPPDSMLADIANCLDERRTVGARVIVEPPVYQGMTVVAMVRARSRVEPDQLQAAALAALYGYFNPLTGWRDGNGWPFGRSIHVGEVYSVLQAVHGTEFIEDVRLFGADPLTGQRGEPTQRIDIGPNALIYSYEHQVRVER